MPRPRRRKEGEASHVSLRPADPFELIRWLARSQSDPRKATAELVQNSLDAGARNVAVERRRIRGELALIVRDDGEGVLPALARDAALRHLATHIGHSHKLGLDPAERQRRVMAGQYGVGLLGFWAIGARLELRTRVAGSGLVVLRLEENSPDAEILEIPLATDAPETYTEVVVLGVHHTAERGLGGRRLGDYLAAELRGQLMRRDVSLVVHDHVARGLAQKRFDVRPKRFGGEPLAVPPEVPVPGHGALRVELYLARGAERPAIQVACAGTLVADDVAALDSLGLAVDPWVGRELVGILDFPSFSVPPGTRRGVAPNAAALAFVDALGALEPLVRGELARLETERRAQADREVARDLRRALRGLRRRLPQYELPGVHGASGTGEGDAGPGATGAEGTHTAASEEEDWLFAAGALAQVRIAPTSVRVAPGGERRVHAVAQDADGRRVEGAAFAWSIEDDAGGEVQVDASGARPAVRARADTAVGREARLRVIASVGARRAEAVAAVRVAEPEEDDLGALGIPEPQLISDADGRWRSRFVDGRWEVNDAHDDYRALRGGDRTRLRYLLALLAKEIVVRTSGRPDLAEPLESLVEILAHAERNLAKTPS